MSSAQIRTRIAQASNAAECRAVKRELESLLEGLDNKLMQFEEKEKKVGLRFKGKNAVTCACGNTIEPTGVYIGTCNNCQHKFCVDCLRSCDHCGKILCYVVNEDDEEDEDNCLRFCECGDYYSCPDCAKECENCSEMICIGCVKELGPYHQEYCYECFDYLNSLH